MYVVYNNYVIVILKYCTCVCNYGCKVWVTTKGDDKKLITFKRKVLRRIYGPYYSTSIQQRSKESI